MSAIWRNYGSVQKTLGDFAPSINNVKITYSLISNPIASEILYISEVFVIFLCGSLGAFKQRNMHCYVSLFSVFASYLKEFKKTSKDIH